jgi:chaperonin cofactor prefoldin
VRKSWFHFALVLGLASLSISTGCSSTSSTPAPTTGSSWSWNPFSTSNTNTISSTPNKPEPDPTSLTTKSQAGADMYISTAKVYEQNNNIEAAKSQYELALKADPKHYEALLGYAHLMDRSGQFNNAIPLYQRAIQAQSKNPRGYNDLGMCYARTGRYSEASTELQKAINLQPKKELYVNNLAAVQVQMNNPEEAAKLLSKHQAPAQVQYNVGQLLAKKGDLTGAAQRMQLATQLDPNMTAARQWMQQYMTNPGGLTPSAAPSYQQVAAVPQRQMLPPTMPSAPAGNVNPFTLPLHQTIGGAPAPTSANVMYPPPVTNPGLPQSGQYVLPPSNPGNFSTPTAPTLPGSTGGLVLPPSASHRMHDQQIQTVSYTELDESEIDEEFEQGYEADPLPAPRY